MTTIDENARYYLRGAGTTQRAPRMFSIGGDTIQGPFSFPSQIQKFGSYIGALMDDQTIIYIFESGIHQLLRRDTRKQMILKRKLLPGLSASSVY